MSVSSPFIARPVATTLLAIAVTLAGAASFTQLPVSALPQIDFPTIVVNAGLPGASPEVMAAAVATPLEKQFTRIAGVTEMTSRSSIGSANVVMQFDLSRDINAAARDVQAAINASAAFLPSNLPSLPRYRKINPADAPILIMAVTSDVVPKPQLYDIASEAAVQIHRSSPEVPILLVSDLSLDKWPEDDFLGFGQLLSGRTDLLVKPLFQASFMAKANALIYTVSYGASKKLFESAAAARRQAVVPV
jgi:multidrug efflux pump